MDLITSSLQEFLKNENIGFYTETIMANQGNGSITSTVIHTSVANASAPASFIVDIDPMVYSIRMSAVPFLIIDSKSINYIRAIQRQWNNNGTLSKLNLKEERGIGTNKCYTMQLRFEILSEANGLTGMLWGKYFKRLFKETAHFFDIEKKSGAIDNPIYS